MRKLLDRLHAKLGDLWWYSLMIFIACRSGDVIQAFIGLWLVPKYIGPEELGAVLPLQQLSGLFAVPLAILATVFAKYVNTYATRGEYGKVKSFIRDVLLAACGVFLVCIAGAYLIIPHFYERLNVQAGMLTVLILAAGFATNIASIFTAALQGLKKFKTMTIQNLIGAPIRLVTLLVAMPFRALSGYILGQATPPASCSLLAAGSLYKDLKAIPMDTSWRKDLPEICRYLWPVAVYMGCITLCNAICTTVYKQRLPEFESAAYYLLSRFSELAGYIGMALVVVIFPLASESHEQNNENTSFMWKSLLAILTTSSTIAGGFFLTSEILFSANGTWSQYLAYHRLLPVMALTTGLSLSGGAVITYEMACRRFGAAYLAIILNLCWTGILVASTGYEFFRGRTDDAVVDFLEGLHMASLPRITWCFFAFILLQLILLLALSIFTKHRRSHLIQA